MSYILDTPTQSNTVFLNSVNCVTRLPNMRYNLTTPIRSQLGVKMLLSVENLTFPNNLNNITTDNNEISFIYDYLGSSPITFTTTIPAGIYNVITFTSKLNLEVSSVIQSSTNLKLLYDLTNFHFTFSSIVACQIINTPTHPTTLGGILGIDRNANNEYEFPISSGVSPLWSIRFPNVFDFSGPKYLFFKMNSVSYNNINSFGDISDTMLRVPINAPIGQIVNYRPTELYRQLIQRSELTTIEVRLEDRLNNVINPPELQVVIRIDYITVPETTGETIGTIDYYFKEFGLPGAEENVLEEEEENDFGF